MGQLKAIIFDVDGTIAETERDGHRLAFNLAFREAGLDWEWSIAVYGELLRVAGGKERIRFYIECYCPNFQVESNLEQFIAKLHQRKTDFYRSLLALGKIPLRPGVRRLIKEAQQAGIRLAIATTSALPNAMALLENTLEPSWFEIIGAGDIVPRKKPAPDIYLYVLTQLGLSPDECLAIEDSEQGLKAATQAGLKTIITVNDYTHQQTFTDAILVLDHLGEPEQPFKVLQGTLKGHYYLNIPLLFQLV